MEKPGILSLVSIKGKESQYFRDYLRKTGNTAVYDFIYYLLGEDYLRFLDLLAGTVLKIPSHKTLYRDIEYIKLYCYVKERGFTEDAVKNAAKLYSKKAYFVRTAIKKISEVLEGKRAEIISSKDYDDNDDNDDNDGGGCDFEW